MDNNTLLDGHTWTGKNIKETKKFFEKWGFEYFIQFDESDGNYDLYLQHNYVEHGSCIAVKPCTKIEKTKKD